jgi:hypothetical protein
MRDELRIGSRSSWVVAWLLAIVAPLVYLLWPGDVLWWVGLLLVMPLVVLAAWRQDKKGFADDGYGVGDGGPWAPPP